MNDIFEFLRNKLDAYLQLRFGTATSSVNFIQADNRDPLVFAEDQITFVFVNLEEERTMRPADRYQRKGIDGSAINVQPELRLNIYLLLVAHYRVYTTALQRLTGAIQFFQAHSSFEPRTHPDLPEEIQKLSLELVTPTFSEQNEIWSTLKATYRPCLLYKVRTLLISSEETEMAGDVVEKLIQSSGK